MHTNLVIPRVTLLLCTVWMSDVLNRIRRRSNPGLTRHNSFPWQPVKMRLLSLQASADFLSSRPQCLQSPKQSFFPLIHTICYYHRAFPPHVVRSPSASFLQGNLLLNVGATWVIQDDLFNRRVLFYLLYHLYYKS